MRRILSILYCSLAVATLTSCKHQTTVVYVTPAPGFVPDGYVKPKQIIEWRVLAPQNPPFDVVVDQRLCNEHSPLHASYKTPARCTVSGQKYDYGQKVNVYKYHFQPPQGPLDTATPQEFYEHVGSCVVCTSDEEKSEQAGSDTNALPQHERTRANEGPQVTLLCKVTEMSADLPEQPAALGSTVTWFNPQFNDWSIKFDDSTACPGTINAHNPVCTAINPGTHRYTVEIGPASSPICHGEASLMIQ